MKRFVGFVMVIIGLFFATSCGFNSATENTEIATKAESTEKEIVTENTEIATKAESTEKEIATENTEIATKAEITEKETATENTELATKVENAEKETATENVEIATMTENFNKEEVRENIIKEEIHEIKEDNAKKLEVMLYYGAGYLNVSNGAKGWAEGIFKYEDVEVKPVVSYDLIMDKGTITVKQPDKASIIDGFNDFSGSQNNRWDINLSDEIPMDLNINAGATYTELDLRGLQLNNLNINSAIGELTIDLSGDWEKSFDVTLKKAMGSTKIYLPSDVGVKINSNKGFQSTNLKRLFSNADDFYVNNAYDNADVIVNINTILTTGDIEFIVK
ncbi:toast rack family protein [Cytobacillus sp. IB215665]|uniref:toast rack family protein n=1 Tax=Cytobacillus sp. IB215665 TaxID=3097357 RepID=UPI002A14A6E5|nr:toast rack family protein [Cytobacillus sp. IB215665]MDX8365396.1 toast rack family protein [Cytobacillus sp. IB215665]